MAHFINEKERAEVKKLFLVEESLAERAISVVRLLLFSWVSAFAVIRAFADRARIIELLLPVAILGSFCVFLMVLSMIAAKKAVRSGRYPRALKYLYVTADIAVFAWLAFAGLDFVRGYSPGLDLVLIALVYTACFALAAVSYLMAALFRFHLPAILYAAILFLALYAVIPFASPFFFPLLRDPSVLRGEWLYLAFFAGLFLSDVGLALLLAAGFRRFVLKHKARERLARFLPETIDREFLARGQDIPEAGARCRAACLSASLEGFSALADAMKPEETVALLNALFNDLIASVYACEGAVDKLTGSGIKALFGAPLKSVDPEANAVRAAIDMIRKVESLNALRKRRRLPALRLGIGIHSGDLTVGTVGGERRAEFTAVGDTVDVAARLEQFTRAAAGRIVVSETARARLGDEFSIQLLGKATLIGRTHPLKVYAVNPWLTPVNVEETRA